MPGEGSVGGEGFQYQERKVGGGSFSVAARSDNQLVEPVEGARRSHDLPIMRAGRPRHLAADDLLEIVEACRG